MVMGRPQRQRAGVTLAAASVLSSGGAVGPGGGGCGSGARVVEAHLVRRVDMVHVDHVFSCKWQFFIVLLWKC